MLCITNITNLDIQARRENVKARMRTKGTCTITFIKNICEAYSNGEVDIIVDSANYSFVISFIGTIGIPKAINELDKTINQIKPCHLAHSYKYNFNTNADISKFTHQQLATYTHESIRSAIELR